MSKKLVTICCHSSSGEWLEAVGKEAAGGGATWRAMTERQPAGLQARAQLVQSSGAFVVLAEVRLQRSAALMEAVNFAHSLKVPLVSVSVQRQYQPSGALAAIVTANEAELSAVEGGDAWRQQLRQLLSKKAKESKVKPPPEQPQQQQQQQQQEQQSKQAGSGVFLSYQADGRQCAELLKRHLASAVTECRPERRNDAAVAGCKVFVAILSPQYEASVEAQSDLDCARRCGREVVPVNAVPKAQRWRPSGWLALAIAGKLYHRLSDEKAATQKQYDSTPINDFVFAVKLGLQDNPTPEEVEQAELAALQKDVAECKEEVQRLGGKWPPPPEQASVAEAFQHLSVEDSQPKTEAELPFNYINYSVTRMTFEPPKPLFDARGVPVPATFDVMLSYQWDSQDMVRNFMEQINLHNVSAWMDIWGGMQGNVNDSMARAVETSYLLVCFLTQKYQESSNCMLELKYALRRDRPVVFLHVQPAMQVVGWVRDLMRRSVVIELTSMAEAGQLDRGIPKQVRVIETIKKVAAHEKRRPRARLDASKEELELSQQLDAARSYVHQLRGSQRYETCTRCSQQYDPQSQAADACGKHSAYFIGGNIMAGRWVCCSQTQKDAPGCGKAPHIAQARTWITITGGATKWSPE